jgi:hypothetical protein
MVFKSFVLWLCLKTVLRDASLASNRSIMLQKGTKLIQLWKRLVAEDENECADTQVVFKTLFSLAKWVRIKCFSIKRP